MASHIDLVELKNEIANDPESLGLGVGTIPYDPTEWKGDQEIADLLNAKNYIIDRDSIEMESVRVATTYDAYNDLSIDEQEFLRWITPDDGMLKITPNIKLLLTGRSMTINGTAGTGTDVQSWWSPAERGQAVPAMLALIEVAGSRAEVLWGEGVIVTASDVGKAANV